MRLSKKWIKRGVIGFVLAPIVLIILSALLFYIPFVQDWAVQRAAAYASQAAGMQVEVGRLRLRFPLALEVSRLRLMPAPNDTLAQLDRIQLSVRVLPLLGGQIELPALRAESARVHYIDTLGAEAWVSLAELSADEIRIDPKGERVYLSRLMARGGDVTYTSTDTTTTEPSDPIKWKIAADEIVLADTRLNIAMPHDSMYVDSYVGRLALQAGEVALETNRVVLGSGDLSDTRITYRKDMARAAAVGFDPQYIAIDSLALSLRNVGYEGSNLKLDVLSGRARERSGLSIAMFQGAYKMDSAGMRLGELVLRTPHSGLYGTMDVPWSIFSGDSIAQITARIDLSVGMQDVKLATGRNLMALAEYSTGRRLNRSDELTKPLSLSIDVQGSTTELNVHALQLMWEDVLDLSLDGQLYNLHQRDGRRGRLKLQGGMQAKASSLLALISTNVAQRYNIPQGIVVDGNLEIGGGQYVFDLGLIDRDARAQLSGFYHAYTDRYKALLRLTEVNVRRFAPHDSIGYIEAEVDINGRGLDILSPYTHSALVARIHKAEYGSLSLGNITADGHLGSGEISFALNSFNRGLNFSLLLDGLLRKKSIRTNLVLDTEDVNLHALGLSEMPLAAKFRMVGELSSDLDENHNLIARVERLNLVVDGDSISPEEIQLEANTTRALSKMRLSSGDLRFALDIGAGTTLLSRQFDDVTKMADAVQREVLSEKPMQTKLEQFIYALPEFNLDMEMGTNNAVKEYLARQRVALSSLAGHFRLRHAFGIEGHLTLRDLRQDTLRINCIDVDLKTQVVPRARPNSSYRSAERPDSMVLQIAAAVDKQRFRSQRGFLAKATLHTTLQNADLGFAMTNDVGATEHKVRISADWDGAHYRISLPEAQTTIAYQVLDINPENYVTLAKSGYTVSANLVLGNASGANLSVMANDMNGAGQEVAVQVQRLELGDYRSLGLPDISGRLGCDVRYSRAGGVHEQPIITGDLSVQEFRYEDKHLGHFATALFYEPRNDQSHYITAQISYQGTPSLSLDAIYYIDRAASLDGTLVMQGFPLEIANPFTAQYATYLEGRMDGVLHLGGSISAPTLSGGVRGVAAGVDLRNYATRLRLDTTELRIEGTTLHFDHYAVRSSADTDHPIYIDGRIEAFGERAMQSNLRIRTTEMTVFDEPRPKADDQLVYGKLIASADLTITGRLSAPKLRGNIGVLGGTNCIYIMREGGLDASDKASGLVRFVDFADTLFAAPPVVDADLGGMDVSVGLEFDPSVRFGVDLTADGADYVRTQGGGAMQLRYPPFGEMSLVGRYEMSGGGTMHYTMPVVGGKLFTIQPSGYVRFEGSVYNPFVHFKATQTVRASAGDTEGNTSFLVSIKAEDYINNIDLSFDLSAPENLSVQNALSVMTPEERGKQAIGLLATGTYLAAGGTPKLDNALTSLLQNQINAVVGSLLRGTDLSLGMEMGDSASGTTNYTYSFSRRFYNDRIRVVIGGKLQTGATASREQSLIDNVSLEYQIDKAGERYLQLYRKRVTDNVLEGEYHETGAGYIVRRKLQRLGNLFNFRKRRATIPADTTVMQVWTPMIWHAAVDSTRRSATADSTKAK